LACRTLNAVNHQLKIKSNLIFGANKSHPPKSDIEFIAKNITSVRISKKNFLKSITLSHNSLELKLRLTILTLALSKVYVEDCSVGFTSFYICARACVVCVCVRMCARAQVCKACETFLNYSKYPEIKRVVRR